MKIKRIDYDDNEDPAIVTAQMSIDEAAFLVKVVSKLTGTDEDALMQGGAALGSEVYATLANMFNHWDDGYDEYLRNRVAVG